MSKFQAVGVMSGTSLDGVDLARCEFSFFNRKWDFVIIDAQTIPYTEEWKDKLRNAHQLSAFELLSLHKRYGLFLSSLVNDFLNKERVDLIASHGHTIFHRPMEGLTFQLGDGNVIAAETRLPVVWDFRSLDVANGGQGAPLVPIGDELLFSSYDFCLNLGGFSNVSFSNEGKRVAFDICPVNFVLNNISRILGMEYDKDGETASSGKLDEGLLSELNKLDYYQQNYPKSLGREWVEDTIIPVLSTYTLHPRDILHTFVEHIAMQHARALKDSGDKKTMLVTGGGAYNRYLMDRINAHTGLEIIIPDKQLVEFKEALVFGFLGVLRWLNLPNCLASVTGAKKNSSGGLISWG